MFCENKALAKTSEFTVPFISLTNRKTCRINRMSPKFQGSVACKRRFEFHPVAKWPRGYKRFFSCLTKLCRKFILLINVNMPTGKEI